MFYRISFRRCARFSFFFFSFAIYWSDGRKDGQYDGNLLRLLERSSPHILQIFRLQHFGLYRCSCYGKLSISQWVNGNILIDMLTSVDLKYYLLLSIQYTLGKWQVNRVWIGHNVASLFDWISSAACGIIVQRESGDRSSPWAIHRFPRRIPTYYHWSVGSAVPSSEPIVIPPPPWSLRENKQRPVRGRTWCRQEERKGQS